MLNEGLVVHDTTAVMKSEMVGIIRELGATNPDEWERAVFRALTGHDREDVDWDFEDNHAGYFTWIKSFDRLARELVEDGFVRQETRDGAEVLVPVETDDAIDWPGLSYPER
jgi:hypothetical protein